MSWLLIALLSYLILAVVFLIDKYLLTSSIPNPKVYAFYGGVWGLLILAIIPFVDFRILPPFYILLSFLAGIFFIYGLFWFYKALQLFEPSRIVPAVGGLLPLFTAGLVYFASRGKETMSQADFLAFILLILGSVLITFEKSKKISLKVLQISFIAALFFAFYFVSIKYVYLEQPFWSAYIWMRIGAFFASLYFFFSSKDVREEIFTKRRIVPQNAPLYFLDQGMGASANILQNVAVSLAPLACVAIINALSGTQYAFLLILTIFLSLKFPRILKEEISKGILFQKMIAILLIAGGLTILALK